MLVLARNKEIAKSLSILFKENLVKKKYVARVKVCKETNSQKKIISLENARSSEPEIIHTMNNLSELKVFHSRFNCLHWKAKV